jgi:hypothetical protein
MSRTGAPYPAGAAACAPDTPAPDTCMRRGASSPDARKSRLADGRHVGRGLWPLGHGPLLRSG